ncbi:hypothetical protein CBM2586_B130545 [Cupriavidus phytorum]|uniref:Uncharacterized protein n=1 Tax=Cupriavidus taiwanensis TaxID=164546 RepID=A0A375CIU8_9BURK|nr:hypothetical protein CBM2586_B130545 [Cupriavidus taiwanensis]
MSEAAKFLQHGQQTRSRHLLRCAPARTDLTGLTTQRLGCAVGAPPRSGLRRLNTRIRDKNVDLSAHITLHIVINFPPESLAHRLIYGIALSILSPFVRQGASQVPSQ